MDVSVSDPSSKTRSPVLKEVRLCIFCSLAVSKPVGDDEDRDNDGVFNREHDKRRCGGGGVQNICVMTMMVMTIIIVFASLS